MSASKVLSKSSSKTASATASEPVLDHVLSVSMRPKRFDQLVGQDAIVGALEKQLASGRVPHFYIFSGNVGSGKTTIARLLAMSLMKGTTSLAGLDLSDWEKYKSMDIQEINAANKTSVDDVRQLIEKLRFKPMRGGACKVIILDEAHQLSNAAQNALLKETEDVPDHVFIMFCTSAIGKIIPALQRRAYVVSPKALGEKEIKVLVTRALCLTKCLLDPQPLVDALIEYDVSSCGLILQATEKYISGVPARECVLLSGGGTLDTFSICRAVGRGDWKTCGPLVAQLTKGDAVAVLCSVMGYLKSMLCKSSGGSSGVNIAKAIETLAKCPIDDHAVLPAMSGALLIACEYIKQNKKST